MKKCSIILITMSLLYFPIASNVRALSIDILSTQYTCHVLTKIETDIDGKYVEYTQSRTTSGEVPISDYLHDELLDDYGYLEVSDAYAEADFFRVMTDTENIAQRGIGKAWAKFEVRFSPTINISEYIDISFKGQEEWFYSEGYVSLYDQSSQQELWKYWWGYPPAGNAPWEESLGSYDPRAYAFLSIDTPFLANNTYKLIMYACSTANGDGQVISIELSGLRDASQVPEPATMLLLGTALIGLAGFRRRFIR